MSREALNVIALPSSSFLMRSYERNRSPSRVASASAFFRRELACEQVERLAEYWAEALGGPSMYSEFLWRRDAVVRIHSGNGVHDEMDRRAIARFDQALAEVGLADDLRCDKCCTTTSPGRP
jgi:truncated hemoglobin YjbI